jgi:hypothetical protein
VSDEERTAWRDTGYDVDPQLAVERKLQRRGRSRANSDAAVAEHIAKWSPARVVTVATCRVKNAGGEKCANLVEVTQDGLDSLETFSRLLSARGEQPLKLGECFPCAACLERARTTEADRNADRVTRVRRAIRQLKGEELATDEQMREAELMLEKRFGPTYIAELRSAIAERSGRGRGARRGKASEL